jgi:8-oxo-dGTP pyrophosphatase MutT (NUDIX family)
MTATSSSVPAPGARSAHQGQRPAPAVTPRSAATTLVLRDGAQGLEVLMVKRSPNASFMPNAYVFPGGAVDAADGEAASVAACDESEAALAQRVGAVTHTGSLALAYSVAALRECFEECGLWLGAPDQHAPAGGWATLRARAHAGEGFAALSTAAGLPLATRALLPWAHWVTPVGVAKRFDTLFFVAQAPWGQEPSVDEGETTTLAWVHPPAALAARKRGEFQIEFATVQTVESLLPFATSGVQSLLDHASALTNLAPLHPRLKLDALGCIAGVLLPGQAGYEQAHQ